MNILVSILVIVGLLAGGGVTVRAAQDDMPNEPLYGIKTWSENVSLQFQNRPEAKVERLMEITQTRVQEMKRLVESGQTPPDHVRLRLEQHLQQTLQLCSNMDDAALDPILLRLRNQLQQQEQDMEGLQLHATPDTQPVLERTRTMLQAHLQLVDGGLQNHEMFRNTVRNGFQYRQTQTPPTMVPPTTSVPSTSPITPNGQQNGQQNSQQNGQSTPQAGPTNGNGPGPNTDPGGPNPGVTPVPKNSGGSGSGNSGGSTSGGGNSGGNNSGDGGSGGNSGGGGSSGGGESGGK